MTRKVGQAIFFAFAGIESWTGYIFCVFVACVLLEVTTSSFSNFFLKTQPEVMASAEAPGVAPKFSAGDMVRTKIGGYVGQVILEKENRGSYEIRLTNPCIGGFLFDNVIMREFELEAVELMDPNNDDDACTR
tara:strand:+ start:2395 stop:2793 length:399 start_codon:yes stop_codon:yes gene_type:complete